MKNARAYFSFESDQMSQAITLLQDWNGFRRGTILPVVPEGQANLLIERGVARKASGPEAEDKKNAKLCENLPVEAPENTVEETPDVEPEKPKKKVAKKKASKKTAKK